MRILLTFVLGAVFGLGLYVSGMTDPGKVLSFLDIFGPLGPFARPGDGRRRVGGVFCISDGGKEGNTSNWLFGAAVLNSGG
ncbi:DUF6691 family protein [Methylocystis echinoides]|uniref:DUF6691 family protein n=1 Tax=Methylocystis echinoides TaxID=29468 RepID=UPI0024909734|nr:DUF6691 family protein [Methylocystis echinoides]